jgi:solute carrier family 35 (UDP-sugar transporter), member A1/2/3
LFEHYFVLLRKTKKTIPIYNSQGEGFSPAASCVNLLRRKFRMMPTILLSLPSYLQVGQHDPPDTIRSTTSTADISVASSKDGGNKRHRSDSFDSCSSNESQVSTKSTSLSDKIERSRTNGITTGTDYTAITINNNTDLDMAQKSYSITSPTNVAMVATEANKFKILLLTLMVLQNSVTVLLTRYTRKSVTHENLYDVSHVIMCTEIVKFILSFGLEYYDIERRKSLPSSLLTTTNTKTTGSIMIIPTIWKSIQSHCFDRPMDALKIVVPAILYLVQNTLLYVAIGNLTSPLYQVTCEGKLVATAFASVVLLQRTYVVRQWMCLVLLSFGVAIVVLDEHKQHERFTSTSNEHHHEQNLVLGLVAVTIACFSSAFAGVYFEMLLKKAIPTTAIMMTSNEEKRKLIIHPEPSLWMRNIQLSFITIHIAMFQSFTAKGYSSTSIIATTDSVMGTIEDITTSPKYFHGFTIWVWILVALQAGGGLLVAMVMKYADNVLKGLATGVSVFVATAISFIFFNTSISNQFMTGSILIIVSVYYFSNPLPCRQSWS